jgi:hypothetical protein
VAVSFIGGGNWSTRKKTNQGRRWGLIIVDGVIQMVGYYKWKKGDNMNILKL